MRIGIDARLWNETGVGRYIRNLVRELSEIDNKNEYILFVLSSDYDRIKNQELGATNKRWKIVKADIPWHSLKEQIVFPRILYKENVDLMHFTYFSVPLLYRRKFVFTLHDLIMYHFSTGKASTLPFVLYQGKRRAYQYIVSQAAKKACTVVVPLESVKEDVRNTLHISAAKIAVTYEGFDTQLHKKTSGVSKEIVDISQFPYFLYVGNTYPHKNVTKLLKAFEILKTTPGNKDLKMLVVGKDDVFTSFLKTKFTRSSDSIMFLNSLSDEDLSALYRHARAYVSASLMEGFGLPPLEAMVLGCPVLLSDIPSHREVCGKAAMYFDPTDEKDMVKKMVEIYNLDREQRQEKITTEFEQVKKFSWKKMAQKTLALYEDCASV